MTWHLIAWLAMALPVGMVALAIIGRRQPRWTNADSLASASGALHGPYWYRVLVAIDCFANALCGGLIGETISARCGRWAMAIHGHGTVWHWIARFMIGWLGVIQPDHGQRAVAGSLARAQQLAVVSEAALKVMEQPAPTDQAA